MFIKLNEKKYTVGFAQADNRLSLTIMNPEEDVMSIYAAFSPMMMPELIIYDEEHNDRTAYIFANHRVTNFSIGDNSIQVDLVVDPLSIDKATELTEDLAEQKANLAITEAAIDDLLALVSQHEEKISAMSHQIEDLEERIVEMGMNNQEVGQ